MHFSHSYKAKTRIGRVLLCVLLILEQKWVAAVAPCIQANTCKNMVFPPLPLFPHAPWRTRAHWEEHSVSSKNEIITEHSLMINNKFAFQSWGEEFSSNKRFGSTLHLDFPVSVCLFSVHCGGSLHGRNTTLLEKKKALNQWCSVFVFCLWRS